jgi:hypothetical protein
LHRQIGRLFALKNPPGYVIGAANDAESALNVMDEAMRRRDLR